MLFFKRILPLLLILFCLFGCKQESFFLEGDNEKQDLRIISLAPSINNMIVALGGGDMIVGVTKFCDNPDKKWQEIGGYIDFNKEVFLSLKPNLVFLAPYHTEAKEICDSQGIEYVELNLSSFRGIRPNIMIIGQKIGKTAEATKLVDIFNNEMLNLPVSDRHPRIMIVLDRTYGTGDVGKCYIVGDDGIFAEPINLVGGINVYEGLQETPVITSEGIVKMNPDVIIDVVRDDMEENISEDWKGLNISAVKKNNLFVLKNKKNTVPDQDFYMTVRELAELVKGANL